MKKILTICTAIIISSFIILISNTKKVQTFDSLCEYQKDSLRIELVKYAKTHIGKSYVWGSKGPNTFDCSGLVQHVYNKFGIKVHAPSYSQAKLGKEITEIDSVKPGDLIFFKHPKHSRVGHVGIIVDKDTTTHTCHFIHATRPRVKINNFPDGKYYSNRFVTIKRII